MARRCAQNRFVGVRDKAPRCRSGRGSMQSFAGPPDPGAGRAQAKVAGTLDAATQTRRGEEEVRVLSSPKFAPVAGAGAQHLAVVACRRSGCRFQGKGMNEHLVANVARRDRPVENSRRRFCPGAPLSLRNLEANAAVADS